MNRISIGILIYSISITLSATPVYHPLGPNLTYGAISNGQTIISDITNPASGASVLQKGENQFRFGVLSSLGVGAEYGSVDNLFDTIDAQSEAFDTGTEINSPADVQNVIDDLNATLSSIDEDGYGKVFSSFHVPLMPIVIAHKGLGGAFVLDINASIISKVRVLHDVISLADVQVVGNTLTVTSNDSTLLAQAAAISEVALGYSLPIMKGLTGTLNVGARLKYYRIGLTSMNVLFGDLEDSEDTFEDVGDEDYTDSNDFGLDLGVLWTSKHYRVGASLANINEPEFDFNDVDTAGYQANSEIIDRIGKTNRYTMEPYLTLEGALFSESQNWVIGAAIDATAVKDPFGDEYQWATFSAAYATNSWLLPGIRVGYRTNLAGSELSYLNAGFTLFKVINLDVAYGLDEVEVDGDTLPRSFILNLGLELTF